MRQTARVVRRDFEFGVAPAEADVRMMIEPLGDRSGFDDEFQTFSEIFKFEAFFYFFLLDLPQGKLQYSFFLHHLFVKLLKWSW